MPLFYFSVIKVVLPKLFDGFCIHFGLFQTFFAEIIILNKKGAVRFYFF